jgi:Holliday junction resolvase-like predicted endonuclease
MYMISEIFLAKLYEILATLQYNSERTELLYDVLKHFLAKKDLTLDIPTKAREIFNEKEESLKGMQGAQNEEEFLKSEWFKQKCLLLLNIPYQYIPEYVMGKFTPFAKDFEDKFNFDMSSLLKFSLGLMEYLNFKKHMIGFKNEVYKFNSKNEYADLGFVAVPPKTYIEKWKNIITISISELKRILAGLLSTYEIIKVLTILSIDLKNLNENLKSIEFSLKPILKINEDTLILLTPNSIIRSLPLNYEKLFKSIKKYRESKGISFEMLTQTTLKMLPFRSLTFNVKYGNGYEVDAILEFKRSIWFVEITSHPPSNKSLEGNLEWIKRDLKKSIMKCIKQGKRCFNYSNELPLFYFFKNEKIKGIFIIVDGVYPQLNLNTAISFFKEKMPIYIINWFDLRTLISQPELHQFEDFLLWRIQQPMPVISFDEKDYWAFYFDRYTQDKKVRNYFKIMQKKRINTLYISYRFNNKKYLENLA